MRNDNILFYYHSRFCVKKNRQLIVPKFQYFLDKFSSNGFNVVYVPRQTTTLFPSSIHIILEFLHTCFVKADQKTACYFNNSFPQRGWFERCYWIFILIIIRPRLLVGFEPSQELCWSCKLFNVKTVDIEHGIRDFDCMTGSYYYRSSYRYPKSIYPDILLTTLDEEVLSSSSFNKLHYKPILINTPDLELAYFSKCLTTPPEVAPQTGSQNQLYSLSVLFLSQYTSRFEPIAKPLPPFIVEFVSELTKIYDLNFSIRLHPKTLDDFSATTISVNNYQSQLSFLSSLSIDTDSHQSLVHDLLTVDLVLSCDSSALKTAVLLRKIVIYWSDKPVLNSFASYSREFLLHITSSNVIDVIELLKNNQYYRKNHDFSHFTSKADSAYSALTKLLKQ